tara:strand:- start:223 stop:861 length:639 start_codon:yes stop_codon:yes gene_type:complete
MNKRGLTTIFIILAIVLLILVFFVLFNTQSLNDALATSTIESWETFEDVSKFEEAMDDCLEEQAQYALETLGMQAGFIHLSSYVEIEGNKLSFKDFTLESMQDEISTYLKQNLERNCDYGQVQDLKQVTTEIKNQEVEITTDWDLEIINQTARSPSVDIESELYSIYALCEQIKENPAVTPMDTNYTIEVTTDYNYYIYSITADDYVFMFGV